jgi:hypothetical protein
VKRDELLQFMRKLRWAIQASVSPSGAPQAAVVGIAVTERLEIIFDTLESTRKVRNLRENPRIAFTVGGTADGDERTVQFEGIADEPSGAELDQLRSIYFAAVPGGRERQNWPGLIYIRARPTWIRYSDFNCAPPEVIEFEGGELG